MEPKPIYIVPDDGCYTVMVGAHIADRLGPDEALWTVAQALQGKDPRFTKSLEVIQERARQQGKAQAENEISALFPDVMNHICRVRFTQQVKEATPE